MTLRTYHGAGSTRRRTPCAMRLLMKLDVLCGTTGCSVHCGFVAPTTLTQHLVNRIRKTKDKAQTLNSDAEPHPSVRLRKGKTSLFLRRQVPRRKRKSIVEPSSPEYLRPVRAPSITTLFLKRTHWNPSKSVHCAASAAYPAVESAAPLAPPSGSGTFLLSTAAWPLRQ